MKSFYNYLAESAREYRYRIKSIRPMDSEFVAVLKKSLFKYDVQSVSKPKKTMMQKSPLDFRDFDLAEVYILDITTKIPASSYVLSTELRMALKLPEKMLVVRSENDPIEIEAQAIEQINREDTEALLNQGQYEEAGQPREVAYGDDYNKKLLDYLAQKKANAEAATVPAIEEIKKTNKFAWLNPKDDKIVDDFNADQDTVKPVHVNTKKAGKEAKEPNLAAIHGNYDEQVKRKG